MSDTNRALPWRSGGQQLADAALRIEALKGRRDRDPELHRLEDGPANLARAYAGYRDRLLGVRAAIDGELGRLEAEQAPGGS